MYIYIIYIYICIYIHLHMHMHMHIHVHIHKNVYSNMHMPSYAYTNTCACIIYTHTYTYAYICIDRGFRRDTLHRHSKWMPLMARGPPSVASHKNRVFHVAWFGHSTHTLRIWKSFWAHLIHQNVPPQAMLAPLVCMSCGTTTSFTWTDIPKPWIQDVHCRNSLWFSPEPLLYTEHWSLVTNGFTSRW